MQASNLTTILKGLRGAAAEAITAEQSAALSEIVRGCSLDAVMATSLASSGHPAGALSSMDIFNMILAVANITPDNCDDDDRDRMVVSHGHTSAGVYASLAAWGFFDRSDAVASFRRAGSPYQGHVERGIRGVDWGTGNLGQGLAAGVGFALAALARGSESRVYVVMGDGEQPKGQLAEARRIAAKESLANITALIDANGIQICGRTDEIMPTDIARLWAADGWDVLECDGHDHAELYSAIKRANASPLPTVIICRTLMGRGVSFMEGTPEYHGKAASGDLLKRAIEELGGTLEELERLKAHRADALPKGREIRAEAISLDLGAPKTYEKDAKKDARGAFGAALADVAKLNEGKPSRTPILAFDCDLAGSVKLDAIKKECPRSFIETGIQEHATATIAGAASAAGVVSVWADFGVFGIDEVYNQQRLNDINRASLNTVLTHVGLDVGEDGMTHQCIDYIGLFRNLFGYKLIIPADANQTDRATRWMLADPSPVCLAFGRSVIPIITDEEGRPLFGGSYVFKYGAIDTLRSGEGGAVLIASGRMADAAIKAHDILKARGVGSTALHISCPLAIDIERIIKISSGRPIVTIEDHHADTGMGSIIAMELARAGAGIRITDLGVTRYGDSGSAAEVTAAMGLTPEALADAAEKLI